MSAHGAFVGHEPCPKCGSSDNLARYEDGYARCYTPGCGYFEMPGGRTSAPPKSRGRMAGNLIPEGSPHELPARALTLKTCARWRYHISTDGSRRVQVANYLDDTGAVVGQKIRWQEDGKKRFRIAGTVNGLYGKWLWRSGGRRVIVVEGEIDALSVDQALEYRWPVVSVPNGAQSAKRALQADLEWLLQWQEIVLAFDMDEAGRAATAECAMLFPPGRCKVAHLPAKDANEALTTGRKADLVRALWEAADYRPDGIVTLADIRDAVLAPPESGLPWCFKGLTEMTHGRCYGEVWALGAGTGIGKTDFLTQQVVFDLTALRQPVGLFFLEQHPTETVKRIAGKLVGKRFHVADGAWSEADLREALGRLEREAAPVFLFNHFGAAEWAVIRDRMRHLAHAEGVRLFYLDHLTALAAGSEEEERVLLERIMAEIGGLAQELNINIGFVSHLATPEGRPHEEGGRVTIRHFKGSRAIGYWSHFMFGLERDQQADPATRGLTTLRVLKDRRTGDATGRTLTLFYDRDTGRLHEVDQDAGFEDRDVEAASF